MDVVYIHPYDFAELIDQESDASVEDVIVVSANRQIDDFDIVEYRGVKYHRTPNCPRTEGKHFIF